MFPGVEHRECMSHLATNLSKSFKGKLIDDNLWPASLTYSLRKHNYHVNQLYTNSRLKTYMDSHHKYLWARSKFGEGCKVEYMNNNLAESRIRRTKWLHLVELLDKIRQMLIVKFELRQRIALERFRGHMIIPVVMKTLHEKTRGLKMSFIKRRPLEAEVTVLDKEKREWRYPVDLANMICTCRQWQLTGLPCTHALYFITSLRGVAGEIDQYVHEYYSIAKLKATYAENVPSIKAKHQWEVMDPNFVLNAPVQTRAPGRPRKTRIRSSVEDRGLGPRKRKCKRCEGL
jgi:hypothetical protein